MIEPINDIQRYLGEETIDHHRAGLLSRREMLVRLAGICGSTAAASALLAACGDSGEGAPAPSAPPATTAPSATAVTAASSSALATDPPTTKGNGAVLSVAAGDPAVKTEDSAFAGPAGTVFGYLARPSQGAGPRPAVIVIHEIFGLTDHIKDVARRLAKAGYLALAVDLVSRKGGSAKPGVDVSGALGQLAGGDAVADLNAGLAYVEKQVDYSGKVGVTGFCYGGGMTLRYAANQPKLAAAVSYYGTTPDPPSQMSGMRAALLAHYGANDSRVNASIPALESNVTGKVYEKRVWDGAGHAFNNDTGGSYNESVAVQAWTLTLGWFNRYLA